MRRFLFANIALVLALVACTSPPPTPTPTSTPIEPESGSVTTVFQDDFEDRALDGWEIERTWSLEGDTWVVNLTWAIEEDGGNSVLSSRVPAVGAERRGLRASVERRTFRDFTMRARVKLLEGDARILFRSNNEPDYGFYDVTLMPNSISLSKVRRGGHWDLVTRTVDLAYGQWHAVAVAVKGETIAITLDERPVLRYEDMDDPIPAGAIEFENRGYMHMDDVAIWLDIPSSDSVTWSRTAPLPAGGVWAISVSLSDPDIVYLATGMNNAFRSEDGGRTWTPKAQLGAHIFAPIAIHPTNSDIIYISNGVVYRSDDGGDTMHGLGPGSGDPRVRAIAIYKANPNIVYAGGRDGDVFRTENGGQSWNPVGVLPGEPVVGTLLVHPTDSDRLFAAVLDVGVYTSADGGVTWTQVLSSFPTEQSLVMHPTNPDILYTVDGEIIYRTTDGGATWSPLASSPPASHLAIATTEPAVLFVSGKDGIYRSADGGQSWSPTAYDSKLFGSHPALSVSPANAAVVYAGVEAGVLLTTDGGASWSWSNNGLADHDAWQLAISPTNPDRLYAGTFCMRGIFVTSDAGATWELVPEHFHYVMEIAAIASEPEVFYVTEHNGLFLSSDGGDTWHHVADTGNYHLHGLAVDPVNPRVAYVGSTGGTGEFSAPHATIYKTSDGGASWAEVNSGFPATATSVQAIAIDPTNTDTVYVATYREGLSHTKGSGIGIYKSTNGGGSWSAVNRGLTTPNVASLAIDPFDRQTLYAGTDRGLFVTRNGGGEWVPVSEIPGVLINAIVPDLRAPGTVYVTTQEAGVLRTTDGGATWVSLNHGLPRLPLGDLMLDTAGELMYVAVLGGYASTPEGGVYRGVLPK